MQLTRDPPTRLGMNHSLSTACTKPHSLVPIRLQSARSPSRVSSHPTVILFLRMHGRRAVSYSDLESLWRPYRPDYQGVLMQRTRARDRHVMGVETAQCECMIKAPPILPRENASRLGPEKSQNLPSIAVHDVVARHLERQHVNIWHGAGDRPMASPVPDDGGEVQI